jgi:translation initiation factor 2B subunit (eIF-2B alpha/beta/delta family)
MEIGLLPTLNEQLLRLDRTYGADLLDSNFIIALHQTLSDYQGDKRPVELVVELINLYDLLLACRPRMANLILDIQKIIHFIHQNPNTTPERIQRKLIQLLILKKARTKHSVKNASTIIEKDKTVLIHSLSGTVLALLEYCHLNEKKPQIIVAAQDQCKTNTLIRHLKQFDYSFTVVSEYAISHQTRDIDLAIFGGLTLTDEMKVIMGPGSGSLIAQLSHYNIPTYIMLTRNKFSYWKEMVAPAYRDEREKTLDEETYTKVVFSHDIVPLHHFTGLISQRGIHNAEEAKELFLSGQSEFFSQEEAIRDN